MLSYLLEKSNGGLGFQPFCYAVLPYREVQWVGGEGEGGGGEGGLGV